MEETMLTLPRPGLFTWGAESKRCPTLINQDQECFNFLPPMPPLSGNYWRRHTTKTRDQAEEEKERRLQKWGLEHRKSSEGMSQQDYKEYPHRTVEFQALWTAHPGSNKRMEGK